MSTIIIRAKNVTPVMKRFFEEELVEKANAAGMYLAFNNSVTFYRKRIDCGSMASPEEISKHSSAMRKFDSDYHEYSMGRLKEMPIQPRPLRQSQRLEKNEPEYRGFCYSLSLSEPQTMESFMILIHPIWCRHDDIEVYDVSKFQSDGMYEDRRDLPQKELTKENKEKDEKIWELERINGDLLILAAQMRNCHKDTFDAILRVTGFDKKPRLRGFMKALGMELEPIQKEVEENTNPKAI